MKQLMITLGLSYALTFSSAQAFASNSVQYANESSVETLQRTVKDFNDTRSPKLMANGMKITKMELTEKSLVYYISVDGSNVNIRTLKAGKKALKKSLLEQYSKSNVQDLTSTIPYCRDAGIGVTYNYFDSKGKSLKISFKSTEI